MHISTRLREFTQIRDQALKQVDCDDEDETNEITRKIAIQHHCNYEKDWIHDKLAKLLQVAWMRPHGKTTSMKSAGFFFPSFTVNYIICWKASPGKYLMVC